MSDKATVLPHRPETWRISDSHGLCVVNDRGVVADLDRHLVAEPEKARTNAALIVLAVNHHDALVGLLRRSREIQRAIATGDWESTVEQGNQWHKDVEALLTELDKEENR